MMNEIDLSNLKSQLLKGVLEYCVLLILNGGKSYSNDIFKKLKDASIDSSEASIYTLLNRLKKEKKVEYEWVESPFGPPRKYYSLTEFGKASLQVIERTWNDMAKSISQIAGIK